MPEYKGSNITGYTLKTPSTKPILQKKGR